MHLSHFGPTSRKTQWFCTGCTSNLFPYNHISDDTEFAQCINEINEVSLSLNELRKGPRLDLFVDLEADRALLNNPDLDPDENYFRVRPNHCTYNTISSLTPVRSQIRSFLSIMHINCRSILSRLSDIEHILKFLSIAILAVSE